MPRVLAGVAAGIGALAAIDNGIGLLKRGESYPRVVQIQRQPGAPNRLIVLFHGYNGHGEALARILGPTLSAYGTVVAFEPTGARYNNEKVLDAADEMMTRHTPDEVVAYGESFGSMAVADWLRRHPSLSLKAWVLNASPSSLKDALGAGSWARSFAWIPGGPISTALLQQLQRHGMRSLPKLEPNASVEAAQRAYQLALQITTPMIFGQVSYIAHWQPPKPNEFAGRVEIARYIHAPSPHGHDGRIRVAVASPIWASALSNADFSNVVVDSWEPESHTTTAERPSGLLKQLVAVMQ